MPPKSREHFQAPPPAQCLEQLKHLIARSKTDFRGHLGPRTEYKTQETVKRDIAARESKYPDGEAFKYAFKARPALGYVATTGSKVRPSSARAVAREEAVRRREEQLANDPNYGPSAGNSHPNKNQYKQRLDRDTGRPEVETVLHWDDTNAEQENRELAQKGGKLLHDGKRTGRRVFDEKYSSDLNKIGTEGNEIGLNPSGRATRQDVEDLTPRHRTALIRALTLAHPKYTKESAEARANQWDPMSQLLSQKYAEDARIAADLKRRKKEEAAAKSRPESARVRNSVRMVAMMRQAQGTSQRAWH